MTEKTKAQSKDGNVPESHFRFRATSVEHLTELQKHIDTLYREGKMCEDKTFRSYVDGKRFAIPESFPNAQSLIIMAVFTPLAVAGFYHKGRRLEFLVPPAYYDIGFSQEQLQNTVARRIIDEPGHRIEKANGQVLMKTLAVRSGLGRYGRNNLCYVDGMGSLVTLHAYFTDFTFEHDDWTDMRMMDKCKKCTVCMKECPNGCITEDNFVINISRCVPLYNEVEGEFPKWMPASAHNALMGCMRCQLKCPANRHAINRTVRLEDISEEETKAIMEGTVDESIRQTISRKMRGFSPTGMLADIPVFTRNLNALIRQ